MAARLNWPCVRVNLDSHVSRLDMVGKDAIVLRDGKQVTEFQDGILPWAEPIRGRATRRSAAIEVLMGVKKGVKMNGRRPGMRTSYRNADLIIYPLGTYLFRVTLRLARTPSAVMFTK